MLFKKELLITRDMKYYAEVTDRLLANGIKYYFRLNSPFQTGRYHGIPFIKGEEAYEYKVYVKRKDLDCAKELL